MGKAALQPFAYGTVKRPAAISLGGKLNYAAGQSVSLSPIPKSGFLARLRYEFSGTVDVTTASAAAYRVPFEQLITAYKLSNSLGYEYRNMSGDSFYFYNQIRNNSTGMGVVRDAGLGGDAVAGSPTYQGIDPSTVGVAKPFRFVLTDDIGLNDGVNFDKFLLSAQTLDNDLTITLTYAQALTALAAGSAAVFANFTMTCAVTAEYYTVPDRNTFELPDTSVVRQVIDDPTYTGVVANGDNFVNVLPIQGPEFLNLGIKVVQANGVPDPTGANPLVSRIRLVANGLDPIMDWTGTDLIQAFFERYGRPAPAGWYLIDFKDDMGLPDAMGPVERLVFSTQSYTQLQLQITLGNIALGAGALIKLYKEMQSEVAA